MPIEQHFYVCNKCCTPYQHYHQAVACESLPIIGSPFTEGETITFENERQLGDRWCYSTETGKVLYTFVSKVSDSGSNNHQHMAVVRPQDGMNSFCEMVVSLSPGEFGERLVSLGEWKFKAGYAENLRQQRMSLGST